MINGEGRRWGAGRNAFVLAAPARPEVLAIRSCVEVKSEMNESLSEFSFERRFDDRRAMEWMQNNW